MKLITSTQSPGHEVWIYYCHDTALNLKTTGLITTSRITIANKFPNQMILIELN